MHSTLPQNNLYPAILAGLQGNKTAANIAQSSNRVQTGSTTSGQVQATHGAAGGQDEHTDRRQYAVRGTTSGHRQPATSGDKGLLVDRYNRLLEDYKNHCSA